RSHHAVKVGKKGNFATALRPKTSGRFRVRAIHKQSAKVAKGASKPVAFSALQPSAGVGSSGIRVKLLQQGLARMAYATPRNGRYDDATGRAVLAYRKVNRMRRTSHANRTVF